MQAMQTMFQGEVGGSVSENEIDRNLISKEKLRDDVIYKEITTFGRG